MTNKRFQVETNEGFVISVKDNLTKKYPFSISCENVDDYENIIDEAMSVGVLLNQLWEQTLRFETHNQELVQRSIKYEDKIDELKNENEQLKQRNDRQADSLGRLYKLIEQKDWRALSDIMDDFKRCDEQLQREWGTYGDVE